MIESSARWRCCSQPWLWPPGAPDVVLERSDRVDPPLELPAPDRAGETTLEQVLAERRSQRAFADTELSLATIGQLFWAGQGISDDAGHRRSHAGQVRRHRR